VRGSEIGNANQFAKAFVTVANHLECAGLAVESLNQVIDYDRFRASAVKFFECLPGLRLRVSNKGDKFGWKDRTVAVKCLGITLGIPSLRQQVVFYRGLEGPLFMIYGHEASEQ
jgi:hypothetical protein